MNFLNLHDLIRHYGLPGIAFIIFAETGLLVGFFLPGESLLISAGIVAATHTLNIWSVVGTVVTASFLGNQCGYLIGHRVGPAFRRRPDGRIYKQKYLARADRYFARYGNRTVLFARFIPIVRTFGPLVAGITRMEKKVFATYNLIGGVIWSFSMIFLGYFAGRELDKRGIKVDSYIIPIVLVVVVLSLIPAYFELRREEKEIIINGDVTGNGQGKSTTGSDPVASERT